MKAAGVKWEFSTNISLYFENDTRYGWVRGCSRSLKLAPLDRPLRLYIGPPL